MTDRVPVKTDRTEFGKYTLFTKRHATLTDIMAQDRNWFIIKNLSPDVDLDMITAWADMWVFKTHLGVVYDDTSMKTLESMEKELFI